MDGQGGPFLFYPSELYSTSVTKLKKVKFFSYVETNLVILSQCQSNTDHKTGQYRLMDLIKLSEKNEVILQQRKIGENISETTEISQIFKSKNPLYAQQTYHTFYP